MEIKTNNYLYLDDFLQICRNNKDKAIMLNVDDDKGNKIIPLNCGHYIADEIWFIQVDLDKTETDNNILGIDFIGECEDEALNEDWGGLYQSPMEHLENCEVRFCTGFNNKDKEFKIEKIVIDNDIIIYLKGGIYIMEEKIKLFQKVIDLAKEYNVDLKVEKNYFYAYMCLLDSIKFSGKEIKFTDKELARLTDRAVDIFLDTDEDSICSIDEITDYLVENYKDLDDLTNIDIIEDILC